MFWISKRAKYPYMNRQDWITRSWLLVRKVTNQDGVPTMNDVRVAKILLHHGARLGAKCPNHLRLMIEEVIINGPTTPYSCPHCGTPKEDLGTDEYR
jgi:hypothetical protein